MNNPHTCLYCTALNFAEIKLGPNSDLLKKKHRKENLAHFSYSDKHQQKKKIDKQRKHTAE